MDNLYASQILLRIQLIHISRNRVCITSFNQIYIFGKKENQVYINFKH